MESVVKQLRSKGYEAAHLDEIVNDVADSLASEINNQGVEAQVEFLIRLGGLTESDIADRLETYAFYSEGESGNTEHDDKQRLKDVANLAEDSVCKGEPSPRNNRALEIVVAGNPFGGFGFWGPFNDCDSGSEWAEANIRDEEWWCVGLQPVSDMESRQEIELVSSVVESPNRPPRPAFTRRELAAILAALSMAHKQYDVFCSMDQNSEVSPLSTDEIDDLCESINFGDRG